MSVVAHLSVVPIKTGSLAEDVATAIEAIDDYDVWYETNPMGTVIEAPDVETLFAAVQAAHEAVDGDRVLTSVKIDEKRVRDDTATDKVAAVESELGREPTSES